MSAPSIEGSLPRPDDERATIDEQALREVEQRVLWLATSIAHAANARR